MNKNVNTSDDSYILIVGKCLKTLRNYFSEHQQDYVYLKDERNIKDLSKRYKHITPGNFTSKDSVISSVSKLPKPKAVIATYENYILAAAWISEHFGLTGLPVSAAEACTDKQIMRQLFSSANEKISPDFAAVENEEELIAFANNHKYPLILKPANLAKSLLVTKAHNQDELIKQYRKATDTINHLYQKYAPSRQPKMIIEEFMAGTVHSVEVFVDQQGIPKVMEQVVDYQTGYDIGFDDNFHYSRIIPSKLSAQDQTNLRHVAEIGCRALGMRTTPAHVEIIMTTDGPRIVEIGARNGGYRERMFGLANGIDITGNAIAAASGGSIDLSAQKNEHVAVLELFPKQPGAFAGLSNVTELQALPSLSYLSIKAINGEQVGSSSDGYKACAIIILHNKDSQSFDQDIAYVNKNVAVITTL